VRLACKLLYVSLLFTFYYYSDMIKQT